MEIKNQSILTLVYLLCFGFSLLFFTVAGFSWIVEGLKKAFLPCLVAGALFGLFAYSASRQSLKNQRDANGGDPVQKQVKSFRLYKPTSKQYLIEVVGSFIFMAISGSLCLLAMKGGDFVLMFISLPFFIVSTLSFIFSLFGMGIGSLRKN